MKISHTENPDGSLSISIELLEHEVSILKDALPGVKGIVGWISNGPLEQKIANVFSRLEQQWLPRLRQRNISPSSNNEEFMKQVISQQDYLDREARESTQTNG